MITTPRTQLSALLLLASAALVSLAMAETLEGEAKRFGEVAGAVVNSDGVPVAGATVNLLDRTILTDHEGRFRFRNLPLERSTALSIRVLDWRGDHIGCTSLSVPVRFYPVAAAVGRRVAVAIVSTRDREPLTLQLKEVEPGNVDSFCAECHKPNPCLETLGYGEGGEKSAILGGDRGPTG